MGAEKDNDIDITYEADMQHSHVITTDKSFNAIEVPATASDLGKFKKKVTKIMINQHMKKFYILFFK